MNDTLWLLPPVAKQWETSGAAFYYDSGAIVTNQFWHAVVHQYETDLMFTRAVTRSSSRSRVRALAENRDAILLKVQHVSTHYFGTCQICACSLTLRCCAGDNKWDRPSLDRVCTVSRRDYVDNFQWLCWGCNHQKGLEVDTPLQMTKHLRVATWYCHLALTEPSSRILKTLWRLVPCVKCKASVYRFLLTTSLCCRRCRPRRGSAACQKKPPYTIQRFRTNYKGIRCVEIVRWRNVYKQRLLAMVLAKVCVPPSE